MRLHVDAVHCDTFLDSGMYFAGNGIATALVDVRRRGNSDGNYAFFTQESSDGYDVVESLAKQPCCGAEVGMFGGSYQGYDQWTTAKYRPPHLATIVPTAAPYLGLDFPWRNNIGQTYILPWMVFMARKTSPGSLFGDAELIVGVLPERFEKGEAFATLGTVFGNDFADLREWIRHPEVGPYVDGLVP